MSLEPPGELQKLRAALHAKAKALPNQRFHALSDKVYRSDVLAHAYACCKANGGVAGVDGRTFADIERYGLDRWLSELAEELRVKTYRPDPVRRVWIPKPALDSTPHSRIMELVGRRGAGRQPGWKRFLEVLPCAAIYLPSPV